MKFFDHFDIIAPFYDRLIKPPDADNFSSLVGLPINGIMLDAAGGTGRSSYPLREMIDRVFIADSSKGMLSQAKKKKCFIVVQSNSEALPFNDETFPRIIMVDALHHVKDYKASLSEFWRVLMVGGRIVIEEPDIQTTTVKLLAIFEKIILMRSHFLHSHEISEFFNFPDARTIVKRNGSTVWIIIEKLGQIAQ